MLIRSKQHFRRYVFSKVAQYLGKTKQLQMYAKVRKKSIKKNHTMHNKGIGQKISKSSLEIKTAECLEHK